MLRKVCLHRGIKGRQRESDKDVIAKLLERMDVKAGRPSPYTGDFGGGLSPGKGERSRTTILVQQGASAGYCYDTYKYVVRTTTSVSKYEY